MATAKYECRKCKRTFSMAAHLARHNSTIHGIKKKKTAKKKAARRGRPPKKVGARRGRPPKKTGARRGRPPKRVGAKRGRPKGVTTRFNLRELNLNQLSELIDAARQAARQKLAELQAAFS